MRKKKKPRDAYPLDPALSALVASNKKRGHIRVKTNKKLKITEGAGAEYDKKEETDNEGVLGFALLFFGFLFIGLGVAEGSAVFLGLICAFIVVGIYIFLK